MTTKGEKLKIRVPALRNRGFTFPKNTQNATKENEGISVFRRISDSIFTHGKRPIFRRHNRLLFLLVNSAELREPDGQISMEHSDLLH